MINLSRYFINELNPDASVRKVLIEKYSIHIMIKWTELQKWNCVQNLKYEKAADWRRIENNLLNPEAYPLIENKILVETYFQLFEII